MRGLHLGGKMKRVGLAALFLVLSISGGMQFYLTPVVGLASTTAGLVVIMAAIYFYLRGERPPILPAALIMWAALGLSTLANLDIWPVAAGRLLQVAFAIGALVVSHRLNVALIQEALYLAGWVWPWLYLVVSLAGLQNHQNIIAVWPVFFILVGLTGRNWLYLLPNVAALLWLGSRGALIGLAVGIIVFIYPYIKIKWAAIYAAPLMVGLVWWRPATAMIRLHYWQKSLNAFVYHPTFGLGPGGLGARHIIAENNLWVTHAHNVLVTLMAENGITGLMGLILALYVLPPLNFDRWQWAIMAALLAHSMVDEPLWWIGPLVASAIIFGVNNLPVGLNFYGLRVGLIVVMRLIYQARR